MSAYALPGFFPPVDNSFGVCFNKSCVLDDLASSDKEEKIEYDPLRDRCEPMASVTVKDAKVDPVLLIQSLTKKAGKIPSKRKTSRCQIRRRNDLQQHQSSHIPQEAAMEFELQINFDGRFYTATRSLARVRQLYLGLRKEADLINSSSCRVSTPPDYETKVPQVPPLQDECTSLGFTLLHDVLRVYVPSLEKWFQEVLEEFPTPQLSPSLSDFFYEPPLHQTNLENVLLLAGRRKFAPSRLDSIEESDSEDEEKEEEE